MKRSAHDDTIAKARKLARTIDRERIASAFVASLAQRPGFWRAPLLALAASERVPTHAYQRFSASSPACAICGFDPDAKIVAIREDGQLLPGDVAGARLALERATAQLDHAPVPTKDDVAAFGRLLALVAELPPTAREGKLVDAITKAKVVSGNRYDRRHVVETLGGCGILETPEYPGFTTKWTTFAARQARPSTRVECDPPIAFWQAAHGMNAENVRGWFGHLEVDVVPPSPDRAQADAAAKTRASSARGRADARAARSTEFERGDAIAISTPTGWVGAVVVRHHQDRGGRTATIVFVDWRGNEAPTLEALTGRRALGFRRGTQLQHAPMMFARAWKRVDPAGRWHWLGERVAAPSSDHLVDAGGTGLVRIEDVEARLRYAVFQQA